MATELRSAPPGCVTQTGVLLSGGRDTADDALQTIAYATPNGIGHAVACPLSCLRKALQGPLVARRLRFLRQDAARGGLPLLISGVEDPAHDGFMQLPGAVCPVAGVVSSIQRLIGSLQSTALRDFVMRVLERRDVYEAFWTLPASRSFHHVRAGGLALHSVQVAEDIAAHSNLTAVERDLGIGGGLLHDIGKVWSYTDDMRLNTAGLAMGHELVGLTHLGAELDRLQRDWADGAIAMRCLLSGQTHKRGNGSLPYSLMALIRACDQRSCEQDRVRRAVGSTGSPVWTPQPPPPAAVHTPDVGALSLPTERKDSGGRPHVSPARREGAYRHVR